MRTSPPSPPPVPVPAPVRVHDLGDGHLIEGTFPEPAVLQQLTQLGAPFPLIWFDPPYGHIVDDAWDATPDDQAVWAEALIGFACVLEQLALPGAALYTWGGYGRPRYRPFYLFLATVEHRTGWRLPTPITWKKKRAYGLAWNYLATREECGYFVLGDPKKPRLFNVPLLAEERGYAGYNKKFPAKSKYLRRTSVWTDITEILRGKRHVAEKPTALARIAIETHTAPGEIVLDPMAGSGSLGEAARQLGRRFVLIENDPASVKIILDRLAPNP